METSSGSNSSLLFYLGVLGQVIFRVLDFLSAPAKRLFDCDSSHPDERDNFQPADLDP